MRRLTVQGRCLSSVLYWNLLMYFISSTVVRLVCQCEKLNMWAILWLMTAFYCIFKGWTSFGGRS